MTQFGVVESLTAYDEVMAAGADYLEPYVVRGFVTGEPPHERLPVRHDLTFPSWAVLFPPSFALADPTAPLEPVAAYLDTVADALGPHAAPGATVVLGSGPARSIPPGVSRTDAEARLAEVIRIGRAAFAASGVELLLEPLRRAESNIFNDLPEAVAFLDRHGLAEVRLVADCFHLFSEGGETQTVIELLDRVGHVHLADRDRAPITAGIWPVADYVRALLEAGYDGRMSFECSWQDRPAELRASLAIARTAAARG